MTEIRKFRKSSFCGTAACVEIARDGDTVLIRDSKHPAIPPLQFTAAEWNAFVAGVLADEFDA